MLYSVGGFILVLLLGFGLRLYTKSDDSQDVLREIHVGIKSLPGYEKNATYIDQHVDQHHAEVFDHAYRMGGRHSSAKFDLSLYLQEMVSKLRDDAKRDGKVDLVVALGGL